MPSILNQQNQQAKAFWLQWKRDIIAREQAFPDIKAELPKRVVPSVGFVHAVLATAVPEPEEKLSFP
jgi:hypothetical protein